MDNEIMKQVNSTVLEAYHRGLSDCLDQLQRFIETIRNGSKNIKAQAEEKINSVDIYGDKK